LRFRNEVNPPCERCRMSPSGVWINELNAQADREYFTAPQPETSTRRSDGESVCNSCRLAEKADRYQPIEGAEDMHPEGVWRRLRHSRMAGEDPLDPRLATASVLRRRPQRFHRPGTMRQYPGARHGESFRRQVSSECVLHLLQWDAPAPLLRHSR